MIRKQKIVSGRLLEINYYPVYCDGRRYPSRAPKTNLSTDEQARYNRKQAQKKLIRLINTNFDSNDIFMHITYMPICAPQSESEARRDIVNYIRRLKTLRRRRLCERGSKEELGRAERDELLKLSQPLKYIYVIEKKVYQRGEFKGRDNWHFHMFVSGGISRDEMEGLWKKGTKVNARRFMPDAFGPEAAAKYLCKEPMGSKRFVCSKGLEKPRFYKPVDGKISRFKLERIAKLRVDDKEYWQKLNSGYKLIKCNSRYNVYNGHWYVSVVMYKTDEDMDSGLDIGWDELLW